MRYVHNFMLFLSWFWIHELGSAQRDITTTQFLREPETLESSNAIFKFGFFSPINSTYHYVGIWYTKEVDKQLEVVWVANRNNPLNDSLGVLKISGDGNLQLLDGKNKSIWSSNISTINKVNSSVAQLLDSGNLVLSSSGNIIWQSFDHPTDSMLQNMYIYFDENSTISPLVTSWKSASDPSDGRFTAGINHRSFYEIFIWDGVRPYWRSGPWNGQVLMGIRAMYYSAQVSGFRFHNDNKGTHSISFSSTTKRLTSHYVLTYDGKLLQKDWQDNEGDWNILWNSQKYVCNRYGKCGVFGSCNSNNLPICSCLRGFEPRNDQEWSAGNWSSGCVRRTPLQCGNIGGEDDGFLRLRNIKVPDNAGWLESYDEEDCRKKCLGNCSCLAYSYTVGFGCMIWNESLIDIQSFAPVGPDIFIRLAHSELGKTSNMKIIIAVIAPVATITFVVFMYCMWSLVYRSRYGRKYTNTEAFKDLTLFKFKNLEVATNNFSELNKLGQGGFGLVYKGNSNGQDIAIKRLSRSSGQGLEEFMNEVLVISKLQHNNLVKLLGCCVEREEKLLVYEYMPNKSLDALLFDSQHGIHLDWKKRFNIINGICRGLLYLHRDSRLKIIHRDLKAGNILIDEDLNPKISDFGMARIFENKQDQANTLRVVGTYGYMSPEYAMEGLFSEKSDVFSLGVLLLEIVSGRKNSSFMNIESMSLLTYAWKLWTENDMPSLIDPTILDPCFKGEILKCIQLGLLCVQEFPEDRPTISALISMLDVDDIMDLPHPTQPGFTHRKVYSTDEILQSSQDYGGSVNNVSLTAISGR